jgi:hypothetical protein
LAPAHDQLKVLAESFSNQKPHVLARSDLGQWGFAEIQGIAETLITLFTELVLGQYELLPEQQALALTNYAESVLSHFGQISQFDVAKLKDRAITVRDEHIRDLKNLYTEAFPVLASAVAVFGPRRQLEANLLGEADSRFKQFESQASATLERLASAETRAVETAAQMQSLMESPKEAGTQIGVSDFEQVFGAQAREHQIAAWSWLAALVLLSALTGWFALTVYQDAAAAARPTPISSAAGAATTPNSSTPSGSAATAAPSAAATRSAPSASTVQPSGERSSLARTSILPLPE